MGTMGQYAVYNDGSAFEVAEGGTYTCDLIDVKQVKGSDFNDRTKEVDKLQWMFSTSEVADSTGHPYRFMSRTGVAYGNEKAGLTILIDQIMGRHLTQEEFMGLDIDWLKSKKYRVTVIEQPGNDNVVRNKIVQVKMIKPAPKLNTTPPAQRPKPEPTPEPSATEAADYDDLTDPFAE